MLVSGAAGIDALDVATQQRTPLIAASAQATLLMLHSRLTIIGPYSHLKLKITRRSTWCPRMAAAVAPDR